MTAPGAPASPLDAEDLRVRLGGDQARVGHGGAGDGRQDPGLAAHRLVAVGPLVDGRPAQHIGAPGAGEPQQNVLRTPGDQAMAVDLRRRLIEACAHGIRKREHQAQQRGIRYAGWCQHAIFGARPIPAGAKPPIDLKRLAAHDLDD